MTETASKGELENLPIHPDSPLSRKDVKTAKLKEQVRVIERHSKIAAWNEYVGFFVSKGVGLAGLLIGGLEALDPNVLHITLKNPEIVAGVGLALLTGKSVLTLIAKLEKGLSGGRQ
jgi:hypothetical protein